MTSVGPRTGPAAGRKRWLTVAFETIERIWGAVLILLVLWLSWRAFSYLLHALVYPTPPPPQVVDLPLRADKTLLARPATAFPGVLSVENPRAPLAHYHRLGTWFQVDHANSCTQSGCHAPLPHGENKADRAFLNMHATALHCGVCHMQTDQTPLPLAWYSIDTARAAEPPALLRAYAWLMAAPPAGGEYSRAQQAEIVGLLRTSARQAGGNPALAGLADHLAAVRADSEEFPRLRDAARAAVPLHFRGEYGVKLALVDGSGRARLSHPGNEAAVREYLQNKDRLTGAPLDAVLARVHPARRTPTLQCAQCHTLEKPLVDLAKLGYPDARLQQLNQPLVIRAIEHMMQGEEFHMPGFTGGKD